MVKSHTHHWKVYSTALVPNTIMVSCSCGAEGQVTKFTQEEWDRAFYAPSEPYPWEDDSRVKIVK